MAVKRWYLTWIEQIRTDTGYKIIATTVQPCHLWMRWTLIPPRIHKVAVTTRGLTTMSDFYYCFDAWEDNEQEEEGDTLIHTFIKEPWPICETRYFYFHGQIDGENSPSTSAVFEKHRKEPIYTRCRIGQMGSYFPCIVPHPEWGEIIPDDDATYHTLAFGSAGAWPCCIEYFVGDDYPIGKVEVLSRARQLPGTAKVRRRFCTQLYFHSIGISYGPLDWVYATEEYQTAMTTFLVNPRTGNPWTRTALNFFAISFRHGYVLTDDEIYGDTRLTWLQVRIWPP